MPGPSAPTSRLARGSRTALAITIASLLASFGSGSARAEWPFAGASSADASAAKPTAVRVFRLGGEVSEGPNAWAFFGANHGIVLPRLLEVIREEAARPEVKTLVFKFGTLGLGMAQAEELAGALQAARKAGRRVIAHVESPDLATLAAASAADELVATPEGQLLMPGLRAEVSFYKDLLQTVGLEADIEAVGIYKSAMEPFTRSTISDAARENLDALLDGLWGRLVELIQSGRGLTKEQVLSLADRGLLTAEHAKKANLVDTLAYWPDLLESAEAAAHGPPSQGKAGEAATASLAWPEPSTAPKLDSLFDLVKLLADDAAPSAEGKPTIAVVVAEGAIIEGHDPGNPLTQESVIATEDFLDTLHEVDTDANVKAIVVRIDSPGGSALASDILWRELQRLGKSRPVIISMGNVAASGGYYMASAGKLIFADATTLTGSIGVFGGKLVHKGLLDKVGVQTITLARGKNAGLFSGLARFSDSEREALRLSMRRTYETFVNRVARGRNMSFDAVDKVAQGRVWTGKQALEVGLVDRLGGLADAVREAAKQTKLAEGGYAIRRWPAERTLMDLFGGGNDSTRIQLALGVALSRLSGGGGGHLAALANELLPPAIASQAIHVTHVLRQLMAREAVMALMPIGLAFH